MPPILVPRNQKPTTESELRPDPPPLQEYHRPGNVTIPEDDSCKFFFTWCCFFKNILCKTLP